MPRGRHPRRRKREGERWSKGTPRKKSVFVLCFNCKRGVSFNGWRRHARTCFGIRHCFACRYPFPCQNAICVWSHTIRDACAVIPAALVPYFWRRDGRRKPSRTDARRALEIPALRWFESLKKRTRA